VFMFFFSLSKILRCKLLKQTVSKLWVKWIDDWMNSSMRFYSSGFLYQWLRIHC
jgi:hypothetical protein